MTLPNKLSNVSPFSSLCLYIYSIFSIATLFNILFCSYYIFSTYLFVITLDTHSHFFPVFVFLYAGMTQATICLYTWKILKAKLWRLSVRYILKTLCLIIFSVYQKLNPKQTSEHHEDHDMLVLFFCPMNTMKSVKFHVLYLFSLLGNDLSYCMHGWNWNLFIFLKC